MLFRNDLLIKDIKQQFKDHTIMVEESEDKVTLTFSENNRNRFVVCITDEITLSFGRWCGHYAFTDDEYERFLWDVKDILNNRAFALSAFVGDHMYINYLARQGYKSADEFMDDDPRERVGLHRTGAVIECVYYDDSKNRTFEIKKGSN